MGAYLYDGNPGFFNFYQLANIGSGLKEVIKMCEHIFAINLSNYNYESIHVSTGQMHI